MFGSGNFWDKPTSWFLKILKLISFCSSNFKIFKNAVGQFTANCPPKHVVTSTNWSIPRCYFYYTVLTWPCFSLNHSLRFYNLSLASLTALSSLVNICFYSKITFPLRLTICWTIDQLSSMHWLRCRINLIGCLTYYFQPYWYYINVLTNPRREKVIKRASSLYSCLRQEMHCQPYIWASLSGTPRWPSTNSI